MRLQLTDVHTRLLRSIRSLIAADPNLAQWLDDSDGPRLIIEGFDSEPWASLTFSGTRHRLDIRLQGPGHAVADASVHLRALLKEPELELPGHFLAEIEAIETISDIQHEGLTSLAIQVEALTIVE